MEQLKDALDAVARDVRVPGFDHVQERARRRHDRQVLGAGAVLVGLVALAVVVLPNRGTPPPAAPSGGDDSLVAGGLRRVLLDAGTDATGTWELYAGPGGCFHLVHADRQSEGCPGGVPPAKQSASTLAVRDGGTAFTLVVGPAPEGAARVKVVAPSGDAADVPTVALGDTPWYAARLRGVQGVTTITGLTADGDPTTFFLGPDVPPPLVPRSVGDAAGVHAPAPQRLARTDDFGRVVRLRTEADGTVVLGLDRVAMVPPEQAPPQDDTGGGYALVDDSRVVREYRVSRDAVLWGSIRLHRTVEAGQVPLATLVAGWRTYGDTLFHVQVDGGVVTGIEEQYRP